MWFHSYEVQEQAQLINSDRGQNGVYLWGRQIIKKGHKKTWVQEMFCI